MSTSSISLSSGTQVRAFEKSEKDKKKLLMEREREYAVENAKHIFANDFGFDQEVVQRMTYAFQLRYKYIPEEYLKLYEKKRMSYVLQRKIRESAE